MKEPWVRGTGAVRGGAPEEQGLGLGCTVLSQFMLIMGEGGAET